MNRFMAFGAAAVFALVFCVSNLEAQCCGNTAVVSNGCCNSVAVDNGCCSDNCCTPRRGLFARIRARRAAARCCTPAPTNCCGEVAVAAPVADCGTCCNTGCNTGCDTCCNNRVRPRRMYTALRRNRCCNTGCNTGCNGCGGSVMETTIAPAEGGVVAPPTPDDT